MALPLSPVKVTPLHSPETRREGFARFRHAMLAVPDLGRADPALETEYLADGQMLGAYRDGDLLGVTNGYDTRIVLPGGQLVRHLSVTHVGVASHATRRGIARHLLTHQLRQARADGYVVAGLRASSATLYGRYGYGVASWSAQHTLRQAALANNIATPAIPVRLLDALTHFPLLREIAARHPGTRPATLLRWDAWWALQTWRATRSATPVWVAVAGAPGAERGFVRYHTLPSDNWLMSTQRRVVIDDIVAADDDTWLALVQHLLGQEVLHELVLPSRPLDDALPLLLRDARTLEVGQVRDESWVRPLDVGALLAARPYAPGPAVVIAVDDPLFPENAGPWRLSAESVQRITAAPQVRVAVADLASLVFGAYSAQTLAAAGRLPDATPASVARLDQLLGGQRQPHAGLQF